MVPSLPTIDQPNLSDTAYRILRDQILSKAFSPRERLDLDAIGDQLGISRTPVKEALLRLEVEGLVEIIPRSGTYVTEPDAQQIADSFDLRRFLEVSAIGEAIERLTDNDLQVLRGIVKDLGDLAATEDRAGIYPGYLKLDHRFHKEIVSLAGNERLLKAHARENLHAHMGRIRYRNSERELDLAQAEHVRILDAVSARDVERARAEMDAHLRRAKRSLLRDMEPSRSAS